jgi:hypothetical protein
VRQCRIHVAPSCIGGSNGLITISRLSPATSASEVEKMRVQNFWGHHTEFCLELGMASPEPGRHNGRAAGLGFSRSRDQ